MDTPFEKLKGKVLVNVEVGHDMIKFMTQDLCMYEMYHSQDCCESVTVESVVGDVADLIGHPLLIAECVNNAPAPEKEDLKEDYYSGDSETWTFYKLATIKGYVDIRWYGTSNGYYSESVDFKECLGREHEIMEFVAKHEKSLLESEVQVSNKISVKNLVKV